MLALYNGYYVKKCLTGVMEALYRKDVEIIVVDDESTDRTPENIDWYADHYENVAMIHQENSGIAVVRNIGIRHAGGEYIGFVDADDLIYLSMMEKLYQSEAEV